MKSHTQRRWAEPGEAIVIRSGVGKMSNTGRFKQARDRKTGWFIERMKAARSHRCANPRCLRLILSGKTYAMVYDPDRVTRVGHQRFPHSARYHFGCVPEQVKPLIRFVR